MEAKGEHIGSNHLRGKMSKGNLTRQEMMPQQASLGDPRASIESACSPEPPDTRHSALRETDDSGAAPNLVQTEWRP